MTKISRNPTFGKWPLKHGHVSKSPIWDWNFLLCSETLIFYASPSILLENYLAANTFLDGFDL